MLAPFGLYVGSILAPFGLHFGPLGLDLEKVSNMGPNLIQNGTQMESKMEARIYINRIQFQI